VVFLGIRYDNRNYPVNSRGSDSCCIDLLVCRVADKHIRASINTARKYSKKISFTDSNPTAAYDGLCVQSFFYYDVFLITNQRAISFALTAFFICTLWPLILGALMSRCPYNLSHLVYRLYSFREVKVGKFAEKLSRFIIISNRRPFLIGKITKMYPLSIKSNSRTPSFISAVFSTLYAI